MKGDDTVGPNAAEEASGCAAEIGIFSWYGGSESLSESLDTASLAASAAFPLSSFGVSMV